MKEIATRRTEREMKEIATRKAEDEIEKEIAARKIEEEIGNLERRWKFDSERLRKK